jgi:hypothetical protein
MKNINEVWTKQFYELAKASPLKIFNDYENDLGKITKECWKIHDRLYSKNSLWVKSVFTPAAARTPSAAAIIN